MDDALADELLGEIQRIPIVDTHDHLDEEGDLQRLERHGLGILLHYVSCDMAACGRGHPQLRDGETDAVAQFDAWMPAWEEVRHGSYMRTLERGLEAVHGVERLTRDNCTRVLAGMRARYPHGEYRRALKELANIEVSLIDPLEPDPVDERAISHRGLDCDPDYFLCDYHERLSSDHFNQSRQLGRRCGVEISDLARWKRAFADDLARAAPYAPGIKCTLGYERRLDFAPVDEAAVAPLAMRCLRGEQLSEPERLALSDHLIDFVAGCAAEHDLPLKFHTGLHAGGFNHLERADPVPLTPFIRRHPRTRIDLFHIAYPYYREAAVLAKYYPNVTVDLCWAWAFSPSETALALDALLDLVPTGKIFGFGGDYFHLEGVVGHALIAREGIARVLANRVRRRQHRAEDALVVARIILRDGPLAHFDVERKRARVRADRAVRAATR